MAKKKRPTDPIHIAAQQRAREQMEVEMAFRKGITALRDFIAPSSLIYSAGYFQLGTRFARSFYVYGYPRQLYTGWLSPIINLDEVIDISMFIYPVESQVVLENLRQPYTTSSTVHIAVRSVVVSSNHNHPSTGSSSIVSRARDTVFVACYTKPSSQQ